MIITTAEEWVEELREFPEALDRLLSLGLSLQAALDKKYASLGLTTYEDMDAHFEKEGAYDEDIAPIWEEYREKTLSLLEDLVADE